MEHKEGTVQRKVYQQRVERSPQLAMQEEINQLQKQLQESQEREAVQEKRHKDALNKLIVDNNTKIHEIESSSKEIKTQITKSESSLESLSVEIEDSKEKAKQEYRDFSQETKKSQDLSSILSGIGAGAAIGCASSAAVIATGGLTAPVALPLTISLVGGGAVLGGGIATCIVYTTNFMNKIFELEDRKLQIDFLKNNPILSSIFCFAASIAVNCISLLEVGKFTLCKCRDVFESDILGLIDEKASSLQNSEDITKFVNMVFNLAESHRKDPSKLNSISEAIFEASKIKDIFGKEIFKLSLKFFDKSVHLNTKIISLNIALNKLDHSKREIQAVVCDIENRLSDISNHRIIENIN